MSGLLHEVLAAFGLTGAEAEFLQHNENLTYRVDGRYLLRIHKAAEGLHVQHDPAARQAELAFLRHLSEKGLSVQQPIAEATLSDGTQATLLTWVEGHALTNTDLTPALCHDLGRMTCQLHHASHDFTHPALHRYDAAFYLTMADRLDDILGHRPIPRTACEAVARCIGLAADTALHGDLAPSNILLTPNGLVPIDFSLCGQGHPMLDLGILLASMENASQMQSICEGYGHMNMQQAEAGFAAGLLGCFALHPDWTREPWFHDRLALWERQILLPVAEHRPIFDHAMNFINE